MPHCKDFPGILTSLFSWLMHSKAKGLVKAPHTVLPHCRSSPHQTEVPPWESHCPELPHRPWGESKSGASQTSAEVESELGRAESASSLAAIHMLLLCEPRAKSTPAAFPGLLKAPLWKESWLNCHSGQEKSSTGWDFQEYLAVTSPHSPLKSAEYLHRLQLEKNQAIRERLKHSLLMMLWFLCTPQLKDCMLYLSLNTIPAIGETEHWAQSAGPKGPAKLERLNHVNLKPRITVPTTIGSGRTCYLQNCHGKKVLHLSRPCCAVGCRCTLKKKKNQNKNVYWISWNQKEQRWKKLLNADKHPIARVGRMG